MPAPFSAYCYRADWYQSRASFTPFAARTQQYVKEQLGQADEKVRFRNLDLFS